MLVQNAFIKGVLMSILHVKRLRVIGSAFFAGVFGGNAFLRLILALTQILVAPASILVEDVVAVSSKVSQVIRQLGIKLFLVRGVDTLITSVGNGSIIHKLLCFIEGFLTWQQLVVGHLSLREVPHLRVAAELLLTAEGLLLAHRTRSSLVHGSCLLTRVKLLSVDHPDLFEVLIGLEHLVPVQVDLVRLRDSIV